jgi:hypothetical protein
MDPYAREEDLKSDDSTKRANQIVRNIDINNILSEVDESDTSQQIINEGNFVDDQNMEISSIEIVPHVETITEENESESNLSALFNRSIVQSELPDLEYVIDQMEIR